ncbi:MAG: hypothetical protein JNN17_01790 [Verrucomicrobiaceae bacterium]|nr:hypothetical protein [Verrucomicrobiaceae bacterium]
MTICELLADIRFWGVTFTVSSVLTFFVTSWWGALLKHGFDQRLENYRREIMIRDKAAVISDVLTMTLDSQQAADKINRHLLEMCLYLPPCLIHKIAHTLVGDKHELNIGRPQLFVAVRCYIEGSYAVDKKAKFTWGNIPQVSFKTCSVAGQVISVDSEKVG